MSKCSVSSQQKYICQLSARNRGGNGERYGAYGNGASVKCFLWLDNLFIWSDYFLFQCFVLFQWLASMEGVMEMCICGDILEWLCLIELLKWRAQNWLFQASLGSAHAVPLAFQHWRKPEAATWWQRLELWAWGALLKNPMSETCSIPSPLCTIFLLSRRAEGALHCFGQSGLWQQAAMLKTLEK